MALLGRTAEEDALPDLPPEVLGGIERLSRPAAAAPKAPPIASCGSESGAISSQPGNCYPASAGMEPSSLAYAPGQAGKIRWYTPAPYNGASRISKRQPLPVFHSSGAPGSHPNHEPVLTAALGTGVAKQKQARIAGPSRFAFRDAGIAATIRRESVAPWLAPIRPVRVNWIPEPRKFDWAQLIAHLADFEQPALPPPPRPIEPPIGATAAFAVNRKFQPAVERTPFWRGVAQFWQAQSWTVRGMALMIPVLSFLAIRPTTIQSPEITEPVVLAKTLPPAPSTVLRRMPARDDAAEKASRVGATGHKHLTSSVAEAPTPPKPDIPIATVEPKLTNVDRMLLARAAIELADDFSFGLDSWDANNANVTAWNYDQTGFIRPRGLALYRPSMSLTNYTIEFLAKIDAVAVGWVVRALDHNNYHAVKLVQRGGGPLPRYTIVRYSVVDGREGPRIEHPLPLNLYKDTLFRIRMDIRGADYSLIVQDSVVDSWTDERFQFGGMGFFSGRGEESRVRWVQVTYQNDLLGRICAWLAPKAS